MRKSSKKPKSVTFIEDGKLLVPHIPSNFFEKVTGIISGGFTMANWIYPLISLRHLPSILPVAFDLQGQVKFTATKYLLLYIPLLSTLSMLRDAHLASYPEKLSYPFKLHHGNVKQVYSFGKIFLRVRCLISQLILFGVSYCLVESSSGGASSNLSVVKKSILGLIVLALVGSFSVSS